MQEIYKEHYKDREVSYAKIGTGEKTIVLFPGVSLVSVLDTLNIIKEAYKIFLDKYTIYIFERPMPLSDDYSFLDMVKERLYVLDKLKIENAYAMGMSIGGMLIQKMTLMNKNLFSKIVLVSTCAKTNEKREEVIRHWEDLSNKQMTIELVKSFYENLFEYMSKEKILELASLCKATKEDFDYFSRSIRTMYNFDIKDEIKNIKSKALVIGGGKDRIFYPEASIEISEELNCELYIYDDYSHGVYDENPEFKERVLAFFEE